LEYRYKIDSEKVISLFTKCEDYNCQFGRTEKN
jgi:hypothetical protein